MQLELICFGNILFRAHNNNTRINTRNRKIIVKNNKTVKINSNTKNDNWYSSS